MVVKLLAVGVAAMFGTVAMAEGGLSVQVNHEVLSYSSASSKSEISGASTTSKYTAVESYEGGTQVILGFNNWAMYLYPNQAGTAIGAGYMVMPELEVGLNLGVSSTSEDDETVKVTTADNNYGLYGKYFLSMGKPSLEIGLRIDSTTTNEKTEPAAATVEKKESGMSYRLGVDYVLPVAGAFSYVGGVSYAMANTKDSGPTAEVKNTNSGFKIKLAGVRLDF